jgi:uncharacterized protein (TIGR02266 family)
MASGNSKSDKYQVLARIFELTDTFPDDQKYVLLKHLVKSDLTAYLYKLIIDLAEDRRELLLGQLEEIRSELKRRSERHRCLITVDYAVDGRAFTDFIQDVSTAGVFIKTNESLEIGQEITLSFMLPGADTPIKVHGRVVRSTEDGYGVGFENLSQSREELIKSLLDKSIL